MKKQILCYTENYASGVRCGDRFNHRLFSSYLVAMYRKGDK